VFVTMFIASKRQRTDDDTASDEVLCMYYVFISILQHTRVLCWGFEEQCTDRSSLTAPL